MNIYINVYSLLLVISNMLIIFFIIQLHSSKIKSNAKKYFIYNATCAFIWSLCYSITISVDDFLIIKSIYTLMYSGVVFVTVFYFLFTLAYVKGITIKDKPILRLLFVLPIIFLFLVITNDINGRMFYSEIIQYKDPPYVGYYVIYGPWYYVHYLYIVILIFLTVFISLQSYFTTPKSEKIFRTQLLIIIAVPLIPVLVNLTRLFALFHLATIYDLTPLAIGISYLLLYLALYRYKFLDVNPLAQKYIFNGINEGIFVLDVNLRLLSLNTAGLETIGISSEDISSFFGNSFLEVLKYSQSRKVFIKDFDKIIYELDQIKWGSESASDINVEILKYSNTPGVYYYNVLITPIMQKENIMGYVIIFRDISDSYKAQAYLNKTNKLQQLIIRLLSHDLANHIQVLNFNSDLLDYVKNDEELKQANQNIKVKVQALNTIINDVLKFLREEEKIYSQALDVYDLNEVLSEELKELEPEFKQKNIITNLNKSNEPALIRANITIKSAIFNILSNAIKFSPPNGNIFITMELKYSYISLKISDQGKGIPDEIKQKVFEPFVSYGEQKGTGLGLTIVRETIQNFNGKVWIENNNPIGTTVFVELPVLVK